LDDSAKLCMGCMSDRGGARVCPHCGFDEANPPVVASQLPLRTVLNDQYVVGRALGAGGFAITYLAWDLRLARRVAIKEYLPSGLASRSGTTSQVVAHSGSSSQDFQYGLERFLEEARLVAQFQEHPGIISVTNYFPANGTAYLVMEYLEGCTLKEYLAQQGGRLSFNQAIALMTPVMDALRELHRANVLHRDISPDNIYITNSGQVKLLDFGAARQALRDRSQRLSVILKVGYAPEEQYRSAGNQGPWTDVYAVGATFYHLITGQIPPPSIDRLAEDLIQPPSALGADIPPAAEEALMTALAVKSSQRYETIQDFQAAIGLPSSTTIPRRAAPVTAARMRIPIPPWAKKIARNRWAARVGAGAGLVVLFVLGFLLFRHWGQPSGTNRTSSYAPPANFSPFRPAHPGEIAPLKDSWPPADLAMIAAKARDRARKWSADAELVEINLELESYKESGYVQTDDGSAHLRFDFYSPSKQQAINIYPNMPTIPAQPDNDVQSMGFVDWGDKGAIPSKFMSLTDAIKKAQQKGMRSPTIKRATLTNSPLGVYSGFKWYLDGVLDEGEYWVEGKVGGNAAGRYGEAE
jgi:serine/threonine protein kinase